MSSTVIVQNKHEKLTKSNCFLDKPFASWILFNFSLVAEWHRPKSLSSSSKYGVVFIISVGVTTGHPARYEV